MPELTIAGMCRRDVDNVLLLCQLCGGDNFLIDFGVHALSANTFWVIFIGRLLCASVAHTLPAGAARIFSGLSLTILAVDKESGFVECASQRLK